MEQHSLADSNVDWQALLEHVVRDRVVVEVQQDSATVARILPVASAMPLSRLNRALAAIPSLGDDVESFAAELQSCRQALPLEPNPWD